MNEELLKLFIKEDCDQHAQSVLLSAVKSKTGTDVIEEFTFNRFNVRLDFGTNQAVIDDELNPADGECSLPIEQFVDCVEAARLT